MIELQLPKVLKIKNSFTVLESVLTDLIVFVSSMLFLFMVRRFTISSIKYAFNQIQSPNAEQGDNQNRYEVIQK